MNQIKSNLYFPLHHTLYRFILSFFMNAGTDYKPVLWNRKDLLRFRPRFLLRKSFGSGSGSFSTTKKSVQILAFSMIEAAPFPRKLASNF
jgi:hypothetical protein